jgi:hypothetical protein
VRSTVFVLVSAAVLALAGAATGASTYASRDLPRIVDPKPVVRGWSFEKGDSYIFPIPAHDPAFTPREWLGEAPTAAQKALSTKLAKAGFVIGRHLKWDPRGGPGSLYAAVVFAFLFRDAKGAGTGFRALQPAKGNLQAKGLGDQSWGLRDARTERNYLLGGRPLLGRQPNGQRTPD